MKHLAKFIAALACVSMALVFAPGAARAAGVSSSWTTDFGPLDLTVDDSLNVNGAYSKYRGKIRGRMTEDGRIAAYWLQPNSERRCGRKVYGTRYWGVVDWSVAPNGDITGSWSYCEDRRGSGGGWSGRLRSGASPMALLGTRGGSRNRRGSDPEDLFLDLLDTLIRGN